MIGYDEALEAIRSAVKPLSAESRPLRDAAGSVLAEPVHAPFDLPQFSNSAVDGYAVLASDLASASMDSPLSLPIAASVQAGDPKCPALPPRSAIRIFTGAPLPPGSDAVVMQEDVRAGRGAVLFSKPAAPGSHVRFQGEEFRAGELLFPAGAPVTPPVVAALAGVGVQDILVLAKPSIGVLSTGNELAPPGAELQEGQIYESNSFGIEAALKALGIESVKLVRCPDDPGQTRRACEDLFATCDLIVTTGGVSVGEHDVVKEALRACGVTEVFWRVAVKPGKPVFFGVRRTAGRSQLVFGLPGNPVSALVTFVAFVAPAIRSMMGYGFRPMETAAATLAETIEKVPGRLEFVRCLLESEEGKVVAIPLAGRSSHMMGAMGRAEGLLHFPAERERLLAGEQVMVTQLRWCAL